MILKVEVNEIYNKVAQIKECHYITLLIEI